MQTRKTTATLLLGVLLVGQFGWTGLALAAQDDPATPTPSPVATVTPEPSATPEPSSTPTPSASPEPSSTPTPSATPQPSVSPSPSPQAGGSKKKDDVSYSKPGVNGCVGIVPKWVYDTTSSTWVQADQGSFTCDPATGYYLSPKYVFDKTTSWYEILPPNAPLTANFLTAPNVVHTVLGDLTVGSKDYAVAKALGLLEPSAGLVAANAGDAAGAAQVPVAAANSQSWFDMTNLVNVITTLQSTATSGDATATNNTSVGSAVTGAASVLANLIKLLTSAWSWSSGSLNFFMQNLFGNLTGDLKINPTETTTGGGGSLGSVNASANGADSSNVIGLGNSSGLDVNSSTGANIVNNVAVNATSGNADATKNTSVGNVASGQALAEVNIINLINSLINSGSSFFGILNIFGNFNGDVLFPEGFLNGALASGASGTAVDASASGMGSSNQVGVNNGSSTAVNNSVYNGVSNNLSTTATSGTASADANTNVGNVGSGSATTTQGLFNIANSSVFGDNAVLVIVNVLGHWVGKIMTLPGTGSTQSALLTGNAQVSANAAGAGSGNQVGIDNGSTATLTNHVAGSITNNVNVQATSGNASASGNTEVGNVSSGDAKAATSVANIFNTVVNVKHWFGVLIINVFGDWLGDVNNNTSAGEALPTLSQAVTVAQQVAVTPVVPVTATWTHASTTTNQAIGNVAGSVEGASLAPAAVLAAAGQHPSSAQAAAAAQNRDMTIMFMISAVLMLVAGFLAAAERRMKRV